MIDNIIIRELLPQELNVLEDMLYEAIFQPEDSAPLAKDVIFTPQIYVYIEEFGKKIDDYCLVAEIDSKIIGAVWIRILADEVKGYGNIDDKTPEFAISLFKEYRGKGVGTLLMREMINYMSSKGYKQTSLSVNKNNYAVEMYTNLGFRIVKENAEDYLMVLLL